MDKAILGPNMLVTHVYVSASYWNHKRLLIKHSQGNCTINYNSVVNLLTPHNIRIQTH